MVGRSSFVTRVFGGAINVARSPFRCLYRARFSFWRATSSANAAPTVPNYGNNHACRGSVADDVVTVTQAQCVPMWNTSSGSA